jgi:hypothetical protein
MSAVAPHQQQGNTRTLTAANTPPAPIQLINQVVGVGGALQAVFTNVGSVDAFIGIGKDAATATANAVAVADNATVTRTILSRSQVTWTIPPGCWVTGFTASSTAVINIELGEGL